MRDFAEENDVRQALVQSARHLQNNEPEEAEALLEPLHAAHPDNLDVAINLGGAYILQRKWSKAVRLLRAATAVHPDNAMLWANLAAAELGRLETAGPQHQKKAIDAYRKALEIDPRAPNVHYQLALIYKERGELNEAAACFRQALKVNPADQDARRWLARIEQIQADLNQADPNQADPNQADLNQTDAVQDKARVDGAVDEVANDESSA